ncbi:hypothetical protein CR513_35336, partial [Mucuna pruriens]
MSRPMAKSLRSFLFLQGSEGYLGLLFLTYTVKGVADRVHVGANDRKYTKTTDKLQPIVETSFPNLSIHINFKDTN